MNVKEMTRQVDFYSCGDDFKGRVEESGNGDGSDQQHGPRPVRKG